MHIDVDMSFNVSRVLESGAMTHIYLSIYLVYR